jgi:hypothetical protein
MAIDPNTGLDQSAQNNSAQPQMTEEQIRAMRGDLSPASAAAEPQLSVPTTPANTTKVIFDGEEPAFSPNTLNQMPSSVDTMIADHGSKKTLWWVIGSVVVVAALGAAGYFVIYPLLSNVTPEPAPVSETPIIPQPVAPQTPEQPTVPEKKSAFIGEPGKTAPVAIADPLSHVAIVTGITKVGQTAQEGVTELSMMSTGTSSLPFGTFFSAVATGFTEAAKTNLLFVDDFTAFIYKDKNGVWPGYVASLKPGFDPLALKSWFTSLEKSPVKNIFVSDPGKMAAFKDGMISEKYPDRYSTGTAAGASFGYVMLPQQQKVVISTSFTGLKEALRLMGL